MASSEPHKPQLGHAAENYPAGSTFPAVDALPAVDASPIAPHPPLSSDNFLESILSPDSDTLGRPESFYCELCDKIVHEKELAEHLSSISHVSLIDTGLDHPERFYCRFCEIPVLEPDLEMHLSSIIHEPLVVAAASQPRPATPPPVLESPLPQQQPWESYLSPSSYPATPAPIPEPCPSPQQPLEKFVSNSPCPGKRINHCGPCQVSIPGKGGLKIHKQTQDHIDTCIQLDLYCADCNKTFAKPKTKQAHFIKVHNPAVHGPSAWAGLFDSTHQGNAVHRSTPDGYVASVLASVPEESVHQSVWGSVIVQGGPQAALPVGRASGSAPLGPRRVVNRCLPCGVSIYETGGLKIHKSTQAHIDICIPLGLYCVECQQTFIRPASKDKHDRKFHDPANPATVPRRASRTAGWRAQNSAALTPPASTSAPQRRVVNTCLPCGTQIYEKGGLKRHKHSQAHIDMCMQRGLYCVTCGKGFNSLERRQNHDTRFHDPANPTAPSGRRSRITARQGQDTVSVETGKVVMNLCTPCGVAVYDKGGLGAHKKTQEHADTCIALGLYCFECKKSFMRLEPKEKHDGLLHAGRALLI